MKKDMTVIIIGAGIAGLVTANGLQKCGKLKVVVYEKNKKISSKLPGRLLDINGMGIDSLREALPYEKCHRLESELIIEHQSTGKQNIVTDRHQTVLMNFTCNTCVDRNKLLDLLAEDIEIHYENKLISYTEEIESGVIAKFQDGSSINADFLVGADGLHSVVRGNKLPEFHYKDMNIFSIRALIPNVGEEITKVLFPMRNAMISQSLGTHQNIVTFSRVHSVEDALHFGIDDMEFIERVMNQVETGNEAIYINYQWRPSLSLINTYNLNNSRNQNKLEMLETMQYGLSNFHPMVIKLIYSLAKIDHIVDSKPFAYKYATPSYIRYTSCVTLIGNAIHGIITTSNVNLSNLAMRDAIDLVYALVDIIKNVAPLNVRMQAHEKMICDRAALQMKYSLDCFENTHSKDLNLCQEFFRNNFVRLLNKFFQWRFVKKPQ